MKNLTIFSLLLCILAAAFVSCKGGLGGGGGGTTTTHGYRFVNHVNGAGPKATYDQTVKIHVETYMGDSLLQSTRKSPGGGPVTQLIPDSARLAGAPMFPPVFEALFLMAEGDSATIYQPIDSTLAKYVPEHLKGKVKEVTYKVYLAEMESMEEKTAKAAAAVGLETSLQGYIADMKAGKLEGKVSVSPNKVKVLILEAGTGEMVKSGEEVSVDYIGARMSDGKKFDESFSRGQTLDFVAGAGQMIPGFDEAVQSIKHGTKAVIFIPYAQAYGDAGAGEMIPAKTDIAFYIDLK
jgi:FKBP-type peptidyl-prolyl cis-trans isomerase FkpA